MPPSITHFITHNHINSHMIHMQNQATWTFLGDRFLWKVPCEHFGWWTDNSQARGRPLRRPQRLICSRRISFIPSTVTAWNHPPTVTAWNQFMLCHLHTSTKNPAILCGSVPIFRKLQWFWWHFDKKIRRFFVEVCHFSWNYVVFSDTSTKNPAILCGSVLVFRKWAESGELCSKRAFLCYSSS